MFTKEQQQTALQLVRATIHNRLFSEQDPLPEDYKMLSMPGGAFVTLHIKGNLRGCIGHMESDEPMYVTLSKLAVSSAFEDRRFPPLSPNEYTDIDIEISVLSPMEPALLEEIQIPGHGVLLSKHFYRSVFLPQVAFEQKWDKKTFMEHLCRKAGLPSNAYLDSDCSFKIFTASIYNEER